MPQLTGAEITSLVMALVALVGVGLQWARSRSENKRDDGAAAESVASATSILIEPLTTRIADLETRTAKQDLEIASLTKITRDQQFEIAELRAGVMLLTNQIVALGHQPIYKPSPRGGEEPR